MAIENKNQDPAAPVPLSEAPEVAGPSFSAGQRLGVGLNVLLTVAIASALLVVINFVASTLPAHRDWSSLGRYSLSERTRKIVRDVDKPITLTILYGSQDPKKVRDEVTGVDYKSRVTELADEIRSAGKKVTVVDAASTDDRAALAARLENAQSPQIKSYKDLISDFQARQEKVTAALEPQEKSLLTLAADNAAWLRYFRQTSEAIDQFQRIPREFSEANDELKKPQAGPMAAYDQQAETVKKTLKSVVDELEGTKKSLVSLKELAAKMAGDDGGVTKNTKAIGEDLAKEFKALQAAMAATPATTQPADALRPQFQKVMQLLAKQGRLLAQFSADQPAVTSFLPWYMQVNAGGRRMMLAAEQSPMIPASVLNQVFNEMSQNLPAGQYAKFLPDWAKAVEFAANASAENLTRIQALLNLLRQIDANSKQFLDGSDQQIEAALAPVRELRDRAEKLPALKTAGLADKFKQENLLLIEVAGATPRLLDFNEVWPQVATMPRNEMDAKERQTRRTFNGDAAVGSAILSAGKDRLAEVVFVHFTGQPNPMMMQMQQRGPEEGEIPYSRMNTLRDRLEKANIKVTEWNLARDIKPPAPAYGGEDEADKSATPPASQPARQPLPRVYVVLPPPLPNPMQQREQEEPGAKFGPQHAQAVKEAIQDGNAIFLAAWSYPRPMGMMGEPVSPKYEWNGYLKEEWGLTVQNDARLIQGIPTSEEGAYNVSGTRIRWMLVNRFDENHPVGRPLNNRRILLEDAAPIELSDVEGVTHVQLLEVPRSDRSTFATRDIMNLQNQIENQPQAVIRRGDKDMAPPLCVMAEASRTTDKGGKARVIVFAAGQSLLDGYVDSPVARLSEEEGLRLDPPPDANPEILVDSVYYLAGQKDWIAAGPVAFPPINVPDKRLLPIQIMVIGVWPLLVLLVGGLVIYLRRLH
ncbi:MAG: hypothetical protein PHU85_01575 [Phycisphaerae bacterium]|nr:hypothetical protein [Phycisphaerae bacterium]